MHKPSKHLDHLSSAIFAAVNVGFIVVMFLIATTKPRYLDPMNIQLPSANMYLVDRSVGEGLGLYFKHGKMLLSLRMEDSLREKILKNVGNRNNISFTAEEIVAFKKIGMVGSSTSNLKNYINSYDKDQNFHTYVGISIDSAKMVLPEWIEESKKANGIGQNRNIRIYIFADQDESYTNIKRVFKLLWKQGIYKFSIVVLSKYA